LVGSAAGGGARSDYGSTLMKLIAAMPTSPAYATDIIAAEMKILNIFGLLPVSVASIIVAQLEVYV
jgi:phage baseplate assembly protein W